MNLEQVLMFLNQYQPLPPDREWTKPMVAAYRTAMRHLQKYPDTQAIPLILGSFGEGDGLGLYIEGDIALRRFAPEAVLPHLASALRSNHVSVRRHALEMFPEFKDRRMISFVMECLRSSDLTEQSWAADAAQSIYQADDRESLMRILPTLTDLHARSVIETLLRRQD